MYSPDDPTGTSLTKYDILVIDRAALAQVNTISLPSWPILQLTSGRGEDGSPVGGGDWGVWYGNSS